jgi:hypothetical protein
VVEVTRTRYKFLHRVGRTYVFAEARLHERRWVLHRIDVERFWGRRG